MGRKTGDGKAFDRAVPSTKVVTDGELYRIGGVNGMAIVSGVSAGRTTPGTVDADDTDRSIVLEADPPAAYSVHIPAALNPNPGDFLFWNDPSTGTGFQAGVTDLKAAPTGTSHMDGPCFLVTSARSSDGAGGYVVRGRIINGVPGANAVGWS